MKKITIILIILISLVGCSKEKVEVIKDKIEYHIYSSGDDNSNKYDVSYIGEYGIKIEQITTSIDTSIDFHKILYINKDITPYMILTPLNMDGHVWCEIYIIKNNDTIYNNKFYIFEETMVIKN